MNSIEIFKNESFGEIRVTGTNDQPLFCLAGLCKVLELTNPGEVKNRLDKDDVQLIDLHALNSSEGITGNSMANFVTESGFYDVILQSSSPRVKPFRKWVTSEVLPAIRKNGGYMSTSNNDTPEEIMARAVMIAQETIKRREQRIEMLELWLKGLPKLTPTNIVGEGEIAITKSGKKMSKWYYDAISLPKEERQRLRSKTFQGIADAMADQWG